MQVRQSTGAPAFPWHGPVAVALGGAAALIARWIFDVPAATIVAFCAGGIFALAVVLLTRLISR